MSLTQQYALDLYRAARRGDDYPTAPGRCDWRLVAEFRPWRAASATGSSSPARLTVVRQVCLRGRALWSRK
jgi:hypothetical protein